ncbi:hypothetical protein JYU14_04930 [Simkania negevensis]|uniref:Nucleoside phosphorylase domain-containing protein n=1 Tax=Simkania negevensis TaxID=83561 RepID=A0ABS3AVB4_9BACT|nr:hypothetical protein [Simkania negevensis]
MLHTLFVFATIDEAAPTIQALQGKESIPGELWWCKRGKILVTGMGSVQAATQVIRHLNNSNQIINAGIAAALKPYQIGDIFTVGDIGKQIDLTTLNTSSHQLVKKVFPILTTQSAGARLLTIDFPLHNKALKQQLALQWDLVDMEGYGIATAAKAANVPLSIVKAVSDFAQEESKALIQQQIHTLAQQLAHYLKAF